MNVKAGSEIQLTVVGRQVVLEPADDTAPESAFRRAMAAVLRRYGETFSALAEHDRGERSL